jgi:hypothetical protein
MYITIGCLWMKHGHSHSICLLIYCKKKEFEEFLNHRCLKDSFTHRRRIAKRYNFNVKLTILLNQHWQQWQCYLLFSPLFKRVITKLKNSRYCHHGQQWWFEKIGKNYIWVASPRDLMPMCKWDLSIA